MVSVNHPSNGNTVVYSGCMQMFGLISVLITVAIGAWWMTQNFDSPVETETESTTSYTDALESAEIAAQQLVGESLGGAKNVVIYDGVSVSQNIMKVDLSGRGLNGSLKAEIRQLTDVQEIDLSNNNFTGLPAEVGQLSKLEVLNLANNPFTGLPHELGNLKKLKILDLRGTQYSEADLAIIKAALPQGVTILVE